MSRNNTARTKEKRKKLRLKNFFKRVFRKRNEKLAKESRPPGITITGNAKRFAVYVNGGGKRRLAQLKKRPTTQRKRRKLARQTGRYGKA